MATTNKLGSPPTATQVSAPGQTLAGAIAKAPGILGGLIPKGEAMTRLQQADPKTAKAFEALKKQLEDAQRNKADIGRGSDEVTILNNGSQIKAGRGNDKIVP